MKKFVLPDYRFTMAGAVVILLAYTVYSFVAMPRPKGLRIYPPGETASQSAAKVSNSAANQFAFSRLNPASFSASFGLDFFKQVALPQVKKGPEIVKPEEVIELPSEPVSRLVDLGAIGYKLKGIIMEKDGNSAAFIYDPNTRKNIVAREKASGTIRILETGLRSVRLLTPDGEGVLELENSKGGKGSLSSSGPSAKVSAQVAAKNYKNERMLRQESVSASGIADMINAGHMKVRQKRGNYSVEMKKVPESFAGYGLRPGDQIIGTGQDDFKRSQDVALKLGQVSERPTALKVRRGRRILYLNPPARKGADEKKQK